MTVAPWSGRKVTEARRLMARHLPAPCARGCGRIVEDFDDMRVGHVVARSERPDLTWTVSNWQVECAPCSDGSGQAQVIRNAQREILEATGLFPGDLGAGQPPPLPAHTHEAHGGPAEPLSVREGLLWTNPALRAATWLQPLLDVPPDAAPPLAMSGPHPEAVGSYGAQAIEWVAENLGVDLRWWQRLAITRQLEHRADGSLCWRVILESGPRRIGKSVRLRSMALWRLDNADLFGERQLTIHTGKDVAIVREIHRQAWAWATAREGWLVRKGVGQEEVVHGDNRWLVRSVDSVYGYDVCQAMVDEAWAVASQVVDDGLEPAMLERLSPQLTLTSTAHRRATTLMRSRLSSALAADDGETLLLLWGVLPGADLSDPAVWRAASPHWSADRERVVRAKYEKAVAGEVDADIDDPDPVAGWAAQYLNLWALTAPTAIKGTPLTDADTWAALAAPVPDRKPEGAAIESWFGEGVSLALAWRGLVSVTGHPDLASAVVALRGSGFTGTTIVGASLVDDPALKGVRTKAGQGRVTAAVADLARLLKERAVQHDGGEHLTDQVLAVRTLPGADGARMTSSGRADAVKAAVWAVGAARTPGLGKPRFILPASS